MTAAALLVGAAQLLATAGVGVYDPARTWTAADTETAIVLGELPQDPPNAVALEFYPVRDDPKTTDSTAAIQIRDRGDENPVTVLDRDDVIFDALHGLHDTTVNGVPVVLVNRLNLMPMSTDDQHRRRTVANYYWQIARPSPYRED